MSSIGSITVYDGAATPVAHTLYAKSVTRRGEKIVAEWSELAGGVPTIAQIRLVNSLERLKSGVYQLVSRLSVPVMEAVLNQNAAGYTAAPKVAYENTTVITGLFHERSDSTGRKLVRQMHTNLWNGIATSVTPVTTGPFAEMFDQLQSPT